MDDFISLSIVACPSAALMFGLAIWVKVSEKPFAKQNRSLHREMVLAWIGATAVLLILWLGALLWLSLSDMATSPPLPTGFVVWFGFLLVSYVVGCINILRNISNIRDDRKSHVPWD